MRKCALWISPWVEQGDGVILDTAALDADVSWSQLKDRDSMPTDTVLLIVHPSQYQILIDRITKMVPLPFAFYSDVIGSDVAASIITNRCDMDPDLRQRLRW